MCRKYCRDPTVDESSRSSSQPSRTMTVPTVPPADRERVIIDTTNLNPLALKAIKKHDPFLYYSIPFVRDEEFSSNNTRRSSLHHGNQSGSLAGTKVERKSRISYECHPDLLLEGLLDDNDGQDESLRHDIPPVDYISQLMHLHAGKQKQ